MKAMEEIDVIITALFWDDWNKVHIARHNVIPDEVERALGDRDAIFLRAKQGRIMVLGRAGGRLIAAVLNAQELVGTYYVITARDMSKKERGFYRTLQENRNE